TCSRIFRKPAMMWGEDPADYEAMRDLVVAGIDQDDVQECFLARDIVDSDWNLLRLLGMRPAMVHSAITRVVKSVTVQDGLECEDRDWPMLVRRDLVGALSGDARASQRLKDSLSQYNLNFELVIGAAFESTLRSQVDTDRMIGAALDRRRRAYRELNEY